MAVVCAMAGLPAATADILIEKNVAARMRDAVVLRADVYRPSAPGTYPVLLLGWSVVAWALIAGSLRVLSRCGLTTVSSSLLTLLLVAVVTLVSIDGLRRWAVKRG